MNSTSPCFLENLLVWQRRLFVLLLLAHTVAWNVAGQVNSGSDGHDGAFNPTTNTVINMADHPDGIYQYTLVNIPKFVTVTFIPNPSNTPVIWLVQSNVVISGTVDVSGQSATEQSPGAGGPGGFRGGNGGSFATPGLGPGGGTNGLGGGNASYGSVGLTNSSASWPPFSVPPGPTYGDSFLIPLLGGSGGGGGSGGPWNGGGGGGAILIAASGQIQVDGGIWTFGGRGHSSSYSAGGGDGSGGAIRLVTPKLWGAGGLGGQLLGGQGGGGRIRLDVIDLGFGGTLAGVFTAGFQPIIIPSPGQVPSLSIASIAGIVVPPNPSSSLANPAVIIPAQQANPVPVVVQCANIPLNTPVSLTVAPGSGPSVQATGANNTGAQASSTATIQANLPHGGGVIYATATIPVGTGTGAALDTGPKSASYAQTGLTTSGERFAKMEIKARLGGKPEIAYITASGKRFAVPR